MTNYFKYKPCQHSNSTYTYTYYEWIEISSSLFTIDYYPCDKTTIDIKYIPYNHTGNFVLGAKGDSPNGDYDGFRFFSFWETSDFYLDYGSGLGNNRIHGGECVLNTLYNFQLGNRYIRDLDTGEDIISGPVVTFDRKTYPINIGDGQFKGKYYSIKIYEDDVLLLNLRPCKRSDGVCGFYDTVNNKFYTNTKAGTQTVGFDNYTQYDYLEKTNNSLAYIITDYYGKDNSRYELEVIGTNSTGGDRILFAVGCDGVSLKEMKVKGITFDTITLKPTVYVNGNSYNDTLRIINKSKYTISSGKLVRTSGSNISMKSFTNSWNGDPSKSLSIFRGNQSPFEGRLYYLNVYENNSMVRNYIPVTNSEGEAGMLDTVNMVFCKNDNPGRGNFNVGNEE